MNTKLMRDALRFAAVCSLATPFIACANAPGTTGGAGAGSYSNVPGASYSAANGGPNVRGSNLPSGGQYNGPGYGHAYPEQPR
jgi:hypothetical protein